VSDLEKAGESAWSRFHAGVVLNTALRAAVKKGLLPSNPCAGADLPKMPKREVRFWDAAQVKAFLAATAEDRLHTLYVLAATTGLREGELFGLKWPDLDLAAGTLSVRRALEEVRGKFELREPKTEEARRRVELPELAVTALHEHRKRMLAEGRDVKAGLVFCGTDGGFLRRSNVARRSFRPAIKRANTLAAEEAQKAQAEPLVLPPIRFHDLRHTAASLLLMLGENPKVVQERLGHSRYEVTMNTYAHVVPTMQKEAARKLDRLLG
jgi:integrase